MTSKEHQEWVIQKLNEDYAKRLEDYKEVIEQQKEIIKQQKDLIDKLLANEYVCLAPKDATCDNKCDSCCYSAPLC